MSGVAAVLPSGLAGLNNAGPHGFSELLYAYTSGPATNGSAFAGLSANTPFYNLTLAAAMFAGRFIVIVPVLCIAGMLAAKRVVPASAGMLPTHGMQFIGLLVGTVVIVGGHALTSITSANAEALRYFTVCRCSQYMTSSPSALKT